MKERRKDAMSVESHASCCLIFLDARAADTRARYQRGARCWFIQTASPWPDREANNRGERQQESPIRRVGSQTTVGALLGRLPCHEGGGRTGRRWPRTAGRSPAPGARQPGSALTVYARGGVEQRRPVRVRDSRVRVCATNAQSYRQSQSACLSPDSPANDIVRGFCSAIGSGRNE